MQLFPPVTEAVDGSVHSQYALQLCTEWARPDKVGRHHLKYLKEFQKIILKAF